MVARGWGQRNEIDYKRLAGTFWGEENALYLQSGGNNTPYMFCQKTKIYT